MIGLLAAAALTLWRTPDAHGMACASCHSPDGIELQAYRFSKDDLDRRASRHLDEATRAQLVGALLERGQSAHAWYSGTRSEPLDPEEDRPFQPGGSVLPGDTPQARDLAFARELASRAPTLAGAPIRSSTDADRVRTELASIDLKTLPIGIPLNRLSEDGFHGPSHASIDGWIPDTPIPLNPDRLAAEDAYLANPSDDNLTALDDQILRYKPRTAAETLSKLKYRALLRFQHYLRTGREYRSPKPGMDANPMWEIAEIGRTGAAASLADMGFPKDVQSEKTMPPADQTKALRLPWYWLGWIADPDLMHSRLDGETQRGDYFAKALLDDGPYPTHLAFCMARKLVEQARSRRFEVQFSFLVLDGGLDKGEPTEPEAKRRFRNIAGNSFRMAMWLLKEDIEKNGEPVRPHSQLLQVRLMDEYLRKIGQPEAKLAHDLIAVLEPLAGKRGHG